MITIQPSCATCKHLLDENLLKEKITCKAFPKGIPPEVILGKNNHSKPLPKQENTTVFEAEKE